MRILLLLVLVGLFVGCTDKGISKQNFSDKRVYQIQDDFYIRKIVIEGNIIYIRCDENGRFIASPYAVSYKEGKREYSTSMAID